MSEEVSRPPTMQRTPPPPPPFDNPRAVASDAANARDTSAPPPVTRNVSNARRSCPPPIPPTGATATRLGDANNAESLYIRESPSPALAGAYATVRGLGLWLGSVKPPGCGARDTGYVPGADAGATQRSEPVDEPNEVELTPITPAIGPMVPTRQPHETSDPEEDEEDASTCTSRVRARMSVSPPHAPLTAAGVELAYAVTPSSAAIVGGASPRSCPNPPPPASVTTDSPSRVYTYPAYAASAGDGAATAGVSQTASADDIGRSDPIFFPVESSTTQPNMAPSGASVGGRMSDPVSHTIPPPPTGTTRGLAPLEDVLGGANASSRPAASSPEPRFKKTEDHPPDALS
mmetsp:Transcript_3903/g.10580  ORF Transcript_3903/g.10580 Transcript_3903/m.10580 type:complete len:347 (-) Transcript_3903:569-1609(-)